MKGAIFTTSLTLFPEEKSLCFVRIFRILMHSLINTSAVHDNSGTVGTSNKGATVGFSNNGVHATP